MEQLSKERNARSVYPSENDYTRKAKSDQIAALMLNDASLRWRERGAKLFERYSLMSHGVQYPKSRWNVERRVKEHGPNVPYLMGFELEIEFGDDDISEVHAPLSAALKRFLPKSHYVCSDGSLENGIEIVSAPLSKGEHRLNFHNYYQGLKAMRELGFNSHDSERCGLHVHISKSALTEKKWKQLKRFICKHRGFFVAISRRTDRQLRWCGFKRSDLDGGGSRYWALNLEPSNTAEFRFFRGTLKFNSFIFALETVLSLVDYARQTERLDFKKWYQFLKAGKYKCDASLIQGHYDSYVQTLVPAITQARTAEERAEARRLRAERHRALVNEAVAETLRLAGRSIVARDDAHLRPNSYSGWNASYCEANGQYERVNLPLQLGSGNQRIRRIVNEEVTPFVQVWIRKCDVGHFKSVRPVMTVARRSAWGRTRVTFSYTNTARQSYGS